ncbi:3-hydroxyacyl-CoA dehydrogenase family protein [Siccirubricoccus phaeus]|uniref:3-hydroxyacyl-CoA dehydrogenase family protein n=1 Tax=Siccirubricoccus phaeus TaxID=2595053 RepID=UPI0011F19670|nr:3-hydroxyacyl-CoA dehydrogenase NAD-binding domain-containing protein [Siccirubricoccus phaeus]
MAAPAPQRHAAIIGFGLMGCDIAAIFLAGGWRVTAVEPARQAWPARRERVALSLSQLGAAPEALAGLTLQEGLEDVDFATAEAVVEAVPEKLALKREVFAQLDRLVPQGIPVASNASGFRITDIAAGCATAARMLNLHFFLPAHLVPGVEVVRGEATSPEVAERLARIMEELGRVVIRVARDMPGFLANRIQHAMVREAFNCLDEGLASPEDVDKAVRFTFGMRLMGAGPVLQKELAGLETQLAAQATIYPSLCNRPGPGPTLTALVEAGKYGPKTGEGFWRWTKEEEATARARYEAMLLATLKLLREQG